MKRRLSPVNYTAAKRRALGLSLLDCPQEVIRHCASFLDLGSLASLSYTCSHLKLMFSQFVELPNKQMVLNLANTFSHSDCNHELKCKEWISKPH